MACDDVDKEFFTGTTIHGVGRIVERSRLVFKILWFFIVLVAFGFCAWQITDRFVRFFEFNVNTEITLKFESSIEFPAITICNFNRYYSSAITASDQAIVNQLLYAMDYDYDYSDSEYSSFDWDNWYSNLSLAADFDYANFTRRVGMQLDDTTLLSCEWRGRSSSCSARNFTHVFTSYGNCYTFNGGSQYLSQDQPGAGNGFRLLINIKQEEYTESASGNVQAGVKFLVHDKNTPPLMDSQGSAVAPGTYAFVAVQQVRTVSLSKPYGSCVSSSTLQYYDEYSLSACLIEWRLELIVQECGCKPFRYPGPARDCTVTESATCAKTTLGRIKNGDFGQSSCYVPCNMTSYPTSVSYAQYPSQSVAPEMASFYNVSESYGRNNLIYLDIYYDEINYEELKQTEAMTPSALVSDIGGQLGFFLGASIITLCEFIEYLIMKCHGACRTKSKKVWDSNDEKEKKVDVAANGDTELNFGPRFAFS
ncbi:acid-sensing ion channel 5-like [Ptychodera flava]|uniref:acid-sensing ion channel 5-like n=1 Tax=Ptychodera flava TaxID=63121 RepID=UPI00396A10A8